MNVLNKTVLAAVLAGAAVYAAANTAPNHAAAVNHQAIAAPAAVTVKQALNAKDNTAVQLKGYVVKAVGDEKYQFRDSTGTINVEIDDELWHGKAVSAKTPVTLIGEVDVDYKPAKRVEIDVDQVKY
ncbi:NirD/YgiW/YdeI family stress tolerance protein [Acinetobacter tianfuensis]|uniref:NirD/YgiW/YdeI family stress tolerance protein n=1 Tax=Acinetobacter tianfuensis TaxID=2419603 RepID=A0A3A8EMC1_9GAMM|nr:NirD/YgiW/YdeI family stress tolerance protein [Acinetobacter tianfuensis]RKG31114.1 NirD/YgiW/YdeI family stress tolerance protein [Acinetobacter tianfuensis]